MNISTNAYCRLCAGLKPLNELTNLEDDKELYQKIVDKLSRFNIVMNFNENILPKTVCCVCTRALERAFTFVTAVEQAQVTLSAFILLQLKRNGIDSDEENIFLEPSNENNEIVVNIKGEDIGNEVFDVNNEHSNVNTREEHNIVKLKHIVYGTNVEDDIDSDEDSIYNEIDVIKDYKSTIGIVKASNRNETDEIDQNFVKAPTVKCEVGNTSYLSLSDEPECSSENINKQSKRCGNIPLHEIKMTWKDINWKCSQCEIQFSNIIDLRSHLIENHNICNVYQCIDCNSKKYSLSVFLKHIQNHRKYLHYSCHICYEKFINPKKACQHKLTHINSMFVCQGCNTCFASNTELNNHVAANFKSYLKSRAKKDTGEQGYLCNICNKTFTSNTGRNHHMRTHTDRKRDHICEVCGQGFYLKHDLKDHMVRHSDARPYQCVICKFSFKTVSRLRYHAHVHSGVKPFACEKCGKCFREKRRLTNHSKTHTENLDFSCSFCNKKFRTNIFLKQHTLQHTGRKPYNCDICPRDFTNWANYNKHMKRKHGIDKARRRHTPQGPRAVDPSTGEVIYPEMEKVLEWKKKMKEPMKSRKEVRQE